VVKKSGKAGQKFGDKRGPAAGPGTSELAKYLNVSEMTLWRWKNDPGYDFPAAAKINSMEFNDLDKVDAWMEARISERAGDQ